MSPKACGKESQLHLQEYKGDRITMWREIQGVITQRNHLCLTNSLSHKGLAVGNTPLRASPAPPGAFGHCRCALW